MSNTTTSGRLRPDLTDDEYCEIVARGEWWKIHPERQYMSDFGSRWHGFENWEVRSRDTIDFKKIYYHITGDVKAALLLSQIIFWHLPNEDGTRKLRVYKKDRYWIAKKRWEWWDEICLSPDEVDRAMSILKGLGIVETMRSRFAGDTVTHIHLQQQTFMDHFYKALCSRPTNPYKT